MMSVCQSLNALLMSFFDMIFVLWGCVSSSNQTLPSEANMISCSMIKASWREKDSFFILLPDTLAQQRQQQRHKAKSGAATIGRSWFKAPKQANAHNSTGHKFECSGFVSSQSRFLQLQWPGIGIQWMIFQIAHRLETLCQEMRWHLQKPAQIRA